ncbi:MAG TPA: tRNA (guanosine(46)-N7)-methyltransferase TrmB [Caulobacteraceae bacterium]|nr:tRNA (guanosine(46)-N7)-methyltransferase TrmB [Caulobacteraceae bacterium]
MDPRALRTYGRVKGRALKPGQAALMQTLAPKLAIPAGAVDPQALMPGAAAVWLEIGFGGGEHLAGQAASRPDVLLLGVEPFVNGVASLLRHVDHQRLANVRILKGDARDLVGRLPAARLERVFILFPDPWPKTRHRKRRLMQADFVAALARAMRSGGRLRFATDWRDYAAGTLACMSASPDWSWTAERALDWRQAPQDHLPTRYERKALGDTAPIFLEFVRR